MDLKDIMDLKKLQDFLKNQVNEQLSLQNKAFPRIS